MDLVQKNVQIALPVKFPHTVTRDIAEVELILPILSNAPACLGVCSGDSKGQREQQSSRGNQAASHRRF
jgi:hypothetical protein